MRLRILSSFLMALSLWACAPDEARFASEVVDFVPGPEAAHGQDLMPEVVLGPPQGSGLFAGSLDVVSLGIGGTITIGTGEAVIVDGPGPDFLVFENAFYAGNSTDYVFAELAGVEVSADGENWVVYPCDFKSEDREDWMGCAGWNPVMPLLQDDKTVLDPEIVGGDPFDLADVGLSEVRFIRITDLTGEGQSPIAGFDLDAVGLINWR